MMAEQVALPLELPDDGSGPHRGRGSHVDPELLAWAIGPGTLSAGDALALMRSLDDASVNLLLTDIPYARVNKMSQGLRLLDKHDANTETFDLLEFAAEAVRITAGNGVVFCGKEQFSHLYQFFDDAGLTTRMLVWEKTNPTPLNGEFVFLSGVECAVHFRKNHSTFNGHCINTVFRHPNGSSSRHPTEKPLDLFRELIGILSNPGDLVLDPCCGSGTTAVACRQLGRRYICNDIDQRNIDLATRRLVDGT